jgi:hypothetical protein
MNKLMLNPHLQPEIGATALTLHLVAVGVRAKENPPLGGVSISPLIQAST